MLYLIMLRYRKLTGGWTISPFGTPFDTSMDAELHMPEICDKMKAIGWIVEIPVPEFYPPLKLATK